MMYFSSMFAEAQSTSIEYKGKVLHLIDKYEGKGRQKLKVRFLSNNSKYTQAVVLQLSSFKGDIYLNGERIQVQKSAFPKINFWQDYAPREFELEVDLKDGFIAICNGADPLGNKILCKHMTEGCAMIIEDLGDKKRYYCNDFENDDDFDDLIFEIEKV